MFDRHYYYDVVTLCRDFISHLNKKIPEEDQRQNENQGCDIDTAQIR